MSPEMQQFITQGIMEMVPTSTDIEWYILLCTECGSEELWMPFEDAASRGHWASEHTRLAKHAKYRVIDIPRQERHNDGQANEAVQALPRAARTDADGVLVLSQLRTPGDAEHDQPGRKDIRCRAALHLLRDGD